MSNRFDFVAYDEMAKDQQAITKQLFVNLETVILSLAPGRSQSLALTALEESYMWVGKAIRDQQIERNHATILEEQRSNS